MPISLVLRTERGEEIRRAIRAYVPAEVTISGIEYPLLGGIDPYSNTIFNARQMRQLLVEVERLLQGKLSSEERASLETVAELCREGQSRAHRFLWFVGD
jgi:hypothetical protein